MYTYVCYEMVALWPVIFMFSDSLLHKPLVSSVNWTVMRFFRFLPTLFQIFYQWQNTWNQKKRPCIYFFLILMEFQVILVMLYSCLNDVGPTIQHDLLKHLHDSLKYIYIYPCICAEMSALWPVIVINSDSNMNLIPCELNWRSLPSIICQHGIRWHWRIIIYTGNP